MGALGGFAKGLADGLQAGQNYRLKDEAAERDQKRFKWEQDDATEKERIRNMGIERQKATKALVEQYDPDIVNSVLGGDAPQKPAAQPVDQTAAPAAPAQPQTVSPVTPTQQPNITPQMQAAAATEGADSKALNAPAAFPEGAAPTAPAAQPATGNLGTQQQQKWVNPIDKAAKQAEFAVKLMRINMKYLPHGASNEDIAAMTNMVEKASKTELGRTVLGAMNGDSEAMARVAQTGGLDASSVKFVHPTDPKNKETYNKFLLVDGNGKTMDITKYAIGAGVYHEYVAPYSQAEQGDKQSLHTDLGITAQQFNVDHQAEDYDLNKKAKKGNIAKTEAETTQLIPAQVRSLDASAAYKKAKAGSVADTKFTGDVLKSLAQKIPTGEDGKPDRFASGALQQIALGSGHKDGGQAANFAWSEFQNINKAADEQINKKLAQLGGAKSDQAKAWLKQKGGIDSVRKAMILAAISNKYPAKGAVDTSYDPEMDSE